MSAPSPPSRSASEREHVDRLTEGLRALGAVAGRLANVAVADDLDRRTLSGDTDLATLRDLDLARLAQQGVEVTAAVAGDEASVTVKSDPRGVLRIATEGEVERLADEDPDALLAAIERGDAAGVLAALAPRRAHLTAAVVNDDPSVRWVPDRAVLEELLAGPNWLARLRRLFGTAPAVRVVVAGAAGESVVAPAIIISGPDADPEPVGEAAPPHGRVLADGRARNLPCTPDGILPRSSTEGLQAVATALTEIGIALCWAWLATRLDDEAAPPRVEFAGARVAAWPLTLSAQTDAGGALALWRWAAAGWEDPARLAAVRQAVALAVVTEADVARAPGPALRTAETVWTAMRSDEVAEALATRRAARDSALKAGRDAAEAVRSASQKVLERVVVQAAATAGILVAQSTKAISVSATQHVLWLIGGLLAASAALAFVVDYPGARSILAAFRADVGRSTETLGPKDIDELRKLPSLTAAEDQIRTSERVAAVILGAAAVALVVAYVWVS